ncbi:lysophosphatidic acid receptor 5b [Misgurnus anguillicaudatus]|uniref:lysophosphatidic acid receptor 5b n=1 Tax=Misgurnus anguillicaudatus TaxID=75329 RepID=UPI0024359CFD|nr:lysophosphatidic acid receptor 5b [Misgurnus anguillicaudatus]
MTVNLTNNTCNQIEWEQRFLISTIVYALVLAVGLPLNTVSLWVLLRRHGLRSSSAVLMINLAASDMLLALSLPLRVYFYATLRWPFGTAMCTAAVMLFRINIRTSCIFITLISLDRLSALVFPLRSRSLRTSGFASKCCCLVWILIILLCIQESVNYTRALNNSPCGSNIFCFEVQVEGVRTVALGQATFFLILLLINIVSTVMVICALRKRPSVDAAKVNNKMSVILIFFVNMMVFIVFILPFSLQLMMVTIKNEEKEHRGGSDSLRALICLASVNCCLDPLIYYFSLDSFWQDKSKSQGDATTHSLSRSMERS